LRYFSLFLILLFTILSGAAHAETESVTVRANRSTSLMSFSVFVKSSCYTSGKVDYSFSNKPDHGKVTVSYQRYTLGKSAGRCAGKPAGAMVVNYTPDRGYRGKDKFTLMFHYSLFHGELGNMPRKTSHYTYNVTVK